MTIERVGLRSLASSPCCSETLVDSVYDELATNKLFNRSRTAERASIVSPMSEERTAFAQDGVAPALGQSPTDSPADRAGEKGEEKPVEKKAAQSADSGAVKTADKTAEKPAEKPDYAKLVRQLGSESWPEREEASKVLRESGPEAVPFVFAARNDSDLEIRRRIAEILHHMVATFEVADLQKSPQLLNCLPESSLSDRRDSTVAWLKEHPTDDRFKQYYRSLVNEAEFLRLNPKAVESKIKGAQKIAADPNARESDRYYMGRYAESLQKLEPLCAEMKVQYLAYCKDPQEKRKIAMEALKTSPEVLFKYPQLSWLKESGVFEDSAFADFWVLNGGDPTIVGVRHKDWKKIEKFLQDRIAEQRKLAGGKDNDAVASAVHILAQANEREGHADEAIKRYREEIEICKKIHPDSPYIRSSLISLARLEIKHKKIDDAIKDFEAIAAIDKELRDKGSSSTDSLFAFDQLIQLNTQKANWKRVAELEETVIKEGFVSHEKDKLADRHRHAAECLERLKDVKGAEAHLKSAVLAKTDEGKGKDYPWAAVDFMALGNFYMRDGRAAEAESYYRRALKVIGTPRIGPKEDIGAMKNLVECLKQVRPGDPEIKTLTQKIAARES